MIADLRDDYRTEGLLEADVSSNPIVQFEQWMQTALDAGVEQPNAMTLATASPDGAPSARIVLLKQVTDAGFVFFTNYRGRKSQDLQSNPKAALVFMWLPLSRQIRVEGNVFKVDPEVSDEYFKSRPVASQIGAWASPQSEVIENRDALRKAYDAAEQRFQTEELIRPPHWGGYCLKPQMIEFWQGQPSRLHDRLRYSLVDEKQWQIERLAP